jgi:hypothetical protein
MPGEKKKREEEEEFLNCSPYSYTYQTKILMMILKHGHQSFAELIV